MKSTVVPLSQGNSTRGDVVKKSRRFQGGGGTRNETSKVTSVSPSPHLFPALGVYLPSCLCARNWAYITYVELRTIYGTATWCGNISFSDTWATTVGCRVRRRELPPSFQLKLRLNVYVNMPFLSFFFFLANQFGPVRTCISISNWSRALKPFHSHLIK